MTVIKNSEKTAIIVWTSSATPLAEHNHALCHQLPVQWMSLLQIENIPVIKLRFLQCM